MEDTLKGAGKAVTYVRIAGDDQGLVDDESRRRALSELGAFLAQSLQGGE